MKDRTEEKQKAVRLREQGLSIKEIAREIPCSSSSVCKWVKHVRLSDDQRKRLSSLSRGARKNLKASRALSEKHKKIRQAWRDEGRKKAAEGDSFHAIGCALYWAEGKKNRNQVCLANTDTAMVKLFFDFLVKNFDVKPKVSFSYHEDEGNAPEPVARAFWANHLGISEDEVCSFANKDKRVRTGLKKKRHLYGMCILTLGSTRAAQHIYGALEVYGGVRLGLV